MELQSGSSTVVPRPGRAGQASASGRRLCESKATAAGPPPRVTPDQLNEVGPLEIEIQGEAFLLDEEGGHVYLSHPRWSLVGEGRNLPEATTDLLREAQAILDVLVRQPAASLGEEARRLLTFIEILFARGT